MVGSARFREQSCGVDHRLICYEPFTWKNHQDWNLTEVSLDGRGEALSDVITTDAQAGSSANVGARTEDMVSIESDTALI